MKTWSDSYLMKLTKRELIQEIRCLEHNWQVAEERCQNQADLLSKYYEEGVAMNTEKIIKVINYMQKRCAETDNCENCSVKKICTKLRDPGSWDHEAMAREFR